MNSIKNHIYMEKKKKSHKKRIKEIMRITRQPYMIAGIHNYCDRWCERCMLSAYCSVFAIDPGVDPAQTETGELDEKFWEQVSDNFEMVKEMIDEGAKKWGIDLSEMDDEKWQKEYEENAKNKAAFLENHEIKKLSRKYWKRANKWFESESKYFEERQEEMNRNLQMGIQENATLQIANEIKDSFEIIHWYIYFIELKFSRALSSQFEEEVQSELIQTGDSDGSAKIALIAVQKSLEAWNSLLRNAEDKTDDIIPLLALLQKIENAAKKQFPNAQQFIRPGFDEPEVVKRAEKIKRKKDGKLKIGK